MGILDFLSAASYQSIGRTEIHLLFQDSPRWANMHRGNFERYLRYRGFSPDEKVERALRNFMYMDPKITFEALVDVLESPDP